MRRLLLAAICSFIMVAGCAWLGLQTPPSVCDDMAPGESVLCDLAGKYDLHLETVGDLFLVVNLRAIKSGAYSADDARWVLENGKRLLGLPGLTPADIRGWALRYVSEYPELLLVSPYLSMMSVDSPITDVDKEMLLWWADHNLRMIQ